MSISNFAALTSQIESIPGVQRFGRVTRTNAGLVDVGGLSAFARVGDLTSIKTQSGAFLAEVLSVSKSRISILPEVGVQGVAIGDPVRYIGRGLIHPDPSWVGRVVDAYANPLDGKPLTRGLEGRSVLAGPPAATTRKRLGPMIETGIPALNTFLPLVRGQRVGLFAGSGVGKSTLLASLAKHVEADYIVIALIGERGREVREFIEDTLGEEGMKRSIVVAATSDQSSVARRRAAWTAMSIAEYLRDQGGHVLALFDSVTRFCEAHREVATASGEAASLRGFPPSASQTLMGLCERSGPGAEGQGDITAVFSVLVAGSDMEEPVADMTRGVLDGHIILDRSIAERGRFPAIDILKSVSRSYSKVTKPEFGNTLLEAKSLMAAYDQAEIMIQTGLYQNGSDAEVDLAIEARPKFERFLSSRAGDPPSTIDNDQAEVSELIASLEQARS